jgi:hypothetical protein
LQGKDFDADKIRLARVNQVLRSGEGPKEDDSAFLLLYFQSQLKDASRDLRISFDKDFFAKVS